MITEVVVLASVVLAAAFFAAWVASPQLRAWVERPKYRFHDAVQGYDRSQQRTRHGQETHRS
ncbi:MAG: hypothetical protein OEW19_22600 [Acidobacteriota bacterium]|nr:hypothetical protein [Acidobacteriota bacterium]